MKYRFKGLDLIDRVPEELQTEVPDIVQEAVIKNIPKKSKSKKGKMVVWGGLKIAEKRREAKGKEKKIKDRPIWMQSSKELQEEIIKPSSVTNVKK